MNSSSSEPVLPIVILPIDPGNRTSDRPEVPPDMRHWQIEEFLA